MSLNILFKDKMSITYYFIGFLYETEYALKENTVGVRNKIWTIKTFGNLITIVVDILCFQKKNQRI